MTQTDYISCIGCGDLFHRENEVDEYLNHECIRYEDPFMNEPTWLDVYGDGLMWVIAFIVIVIGGTILLQIT